MRTLSDETPLYFLTPGVSTPFSGYVLWSSVCFSATRSSTPSVAISIVFCIGSDHRCESREHQVAQAVDSVSPLRYQAHCGTSSSVVSRVIWPLPTPRHESGRLFRNPSLAIPQRDRHSHRKLASYSARVCIFPQQFAYNIDVAKYPHSLVLHRCPVAHRCRLCFIGSYRSVHVVTALATMVHDHVLTRSPKAP